VPCGYCQEPITEDQPSSWKWFPADKQMKKVHSFHLDTRRNMDVSWPADGNKNTKFKRKGNDDGEPK
jgi:hypothetical protein